MNKHSTPILSVVRAMHAEDDAADPYNRGFRRFADPAAPTSPGQRHEADQLLACYETELTLENDK